MVPPWVVWCLVIFYRMSDGNARELGWGGGIVAGIMDSSGVSTSHNLGIMDSYGMTTSHKTRFCLKYYVSLNRSLTCS